MFFRRHSAKNHSQNIKEIHFAQKMLLLVYNFVMTVLVGDIIKALTLENLNPHILDQDHGVLGMLSIRADEIEKEIALVIMLYHIIVLINTSFLTFLTGSTEIFVRLYRSCKYWRWFCKQQKVTDYIHSTGLLTCLFVQSFEISFFSSLQHVLILK